MTFNPVWHRMLYSCTHTAPVSVKGWISHLLQRQQTPGIQNTFLNLNFCQIYFLPWTPLTALVAALQECLAHRQIPGYNYGHKLANCHLCTSAVEILPKMNWNVVESQKFQWFHTKLLSLRTMLISNVILWPDTVRARSKTTAVAVQSSKYKNNIYKSQSQSL